MSGGSFQSPPFFPQSCQNSANNISSRISFPEFNNCLPLDTWGPQPNNYPLVYVPNGCDSTLWQQQRILSVVNYVVSLNLNYCHHHTPGWLALNSPVFRTIINGSSGICADRGVNGTNQWQGIDCSTYTSFVYNFGLGTNLNKDVQQQACGPNAPGRVLNIKNLTNTANQNLMEPGDLLYIAGDGNISHVIMWTGHQLTNGTGAFGIDTIIQSYPADTSEFVYNAGMDSLKNNETIYLISDSTGTGPNYRMFISWYVSQFSHARRIINPDVNLPTYCP